MKKSMNESPLSAPSPSGPDSSPIPVDRMEWGKLVFSEGGLSTFVIFPLVVLYFLARALGLV